MTTCSIARAGVNRRPECRWWMAVLFPLVIMATLFGRCRGLLCHCDSPGSSNPEHEICSAGGHRQTCNSSLSCVTQFHIDDGQWVIHFRCLEHYNIPGLSIPVYCNETEGGLESLPGLAYFCCDSYDLCNLALRTVYPFSSSALMMETLATPSPTILSAGSSLIVPVAVPLCILLLLALILSTFILALCLYLRRRKKRKENQSLMLAYNPPFPTFDLLDSSTGMSYTSGSGKGQPFMFQRTIARNITVGDLIGSGRYGNVYVGEFRGDPVAIKKFESWDEKSWVRETQIYNTVWMRNDNILGFIASDTISLNGGVTELWLITEYHPLGSLHDYLSKHMLSKAITVSFVLCCIKGLIHLHTELVGTEFKPAIAHRDIKSRNILVKRDGGCCIADFGLAVIKEKGANRALVPENPKQGTRRYMSPEVLGDAMISREFRTMVKGDIYAMGLVLWEMCKCCIDSNGVADEYEVPFQDLVPQDPSFEEMKQLVVLERRQPNIPNRWSKDEFLSGMGRMMKECWYSDPTARPSAIALRAKISRLTQGNKLDESAMVSLASESDLAFQRNCQAFSSTKDGWSKALLGSSKSSRF